MTPRSAPSALAAKCTGRVRMDGEHDRQAGSGSVRSFDATLLGARERLAGSEYASAEGRRVGCAEPGPGMPLMEGEAEVAYAVRGPRS